MGVQAACALAASGHLAGRQPADEQVDGEHKQAAPLKDACATSSLSALGFSSSPLAVAASKPITRRDLFGAIPGAAAGAAAIAAVGAAVGVAGCSSSDSSSGPDVLTVATGSVTTLESFKEISKPGKYYELETVLELDAGTQLFSSGSKVACATAPGSSSRSLTQICLMGLESGRYVAALEDAQGKDESFVIHEARCSDSLLLWIECNYLTDQWRLYSASIDDDDLSVGQPALLDEGDADYDVPEIAVVDNQAYWILQPSEDGAKGSEDSLLKTNGGIAYTSHGRFNGGLYVSGKTLVCMPRYDSKSSVYYQLTAIQGSGVVASQVLPHGFKPSTFTYVNGSFSFGISAGYDYGDGIANVGTYVAVGDGTWLRLTRTPVTPAGSASGWVFCKSSSRTVFVDLAKKRYFTISAPSGSEDYGDFQIATGDLDGSLFNYATVTQVKKGKTTRKVEVRSIKLVDIS